MRSNGGGRPLLGAQPIPASSYADTAWTANLVPTWQYINQTPAERAAGIQWGLAGTPEEFLEAVALGFVPNDPAGLETYMYWRGASTAERVAAGLIEFQVWLDRQIWRAAGEPPSLALAIWSKIQANVASGAYPGTIEEWEGYLRQYFGAVPMDLVENPVTGGWHERATVVYDGPDPDAPGMYIFRLADGSEWSYAGADFTAPATELRDQTIAHFVVGSVLPGSADTREVLAVDYETPWSDGTVRSTGWQRYAAQLSIAQIENLFPGSGWTVLVHEWATLGTAERAAITAALASSGWTPTAGGGIERTGDDGNLVLPQNPGGVTIVPAPGSPNPVTIYDANGNVRTIPTATSDPNAGPVVPPGDWWTNTVTPVTGSPAPGQPGNRSAPPVVSITPGDPTAIPPGAVTTALPGGNSTLMIGLAALAGLALLAWPRRRR